MRTFPIVADRAIESIDFTEQRECGSCDACCVYTSRKVFDREYKFGERCQYLTTGCSIYETRPVYPCQLFKCMWLLYPLRIPDWMRPDKSNVILVERKDHVGVIICDRDQNFDPAIEWALNFTRQNNLNVEIAVDSNLVIAHGTTEFVEQRKINDTKY